MRAREFIVERKMPERKSSTMPFSKRFPSMPSSNAYAAYRFGMAMADHTITSAEGPASNYAVIVAYTPEEEDIVRGGEKQTGHIGQTLTDRGSREPKTTDTVSPVAKPKRNRYGV
jgi:precorrin-6B methylase 1